MRIAVFGDIHSNIYALKQGLAEIERSGVEHCIVTGDIFGYYPWAAETYTAIKNCKLTCTIIKGNHDQLILDKLVNPDMEVEVSYWEAVVQNLQQLESTTPDAIGWLSGLSDRATFSSDKYIYHIYHGTPVDPLNGRFYPDNETDYPWFPQKGEVLILGHTHYPLIKTPAARGNIINPGSIGQPRDGNIDPSWILIDEETGAMELKRFSYDIASVVHELLSISWDERAIKALNKTNKGKLIL